MHKDIFGDPEQDPRIYGSSSKGDSKFTEITKGIFTSCKKMIVAHLGASSQKKLLMIKLKKFNL